MSLRVYAPEAGKKVQLKVEDATDPTKSVETYALTTTANGWQTLNFDFAQQAAGTAAFDNATTYNKASVFFDFLANASGQTYYFDDLAYNKSSTATTTTYSAPSNLKESFNSAAGITDFEGAVTSLASTDAPAGSSGSVIKSVKPAGAQPWAGSTISSITDGEFIATGSTTMSLRVYAPEAGKKVQLKVEDATDPTKSVETYALTTTANGWQTLNFDFAQQAAGTAAFDNATTYNKASVFFDFLANASGQTYYFDDLAYNKAVIAA